MTHAAAPAPQTLAVFAAGSLRAAFGELAQGFELACPGWRLALTFGAAGLLLQRIAQGEQPEVFASANLSLPQQLHAAGQYTAPQVFTRNALCALAAPALRVNSETLAATLLNPAVRVGTSTPGADPSGDYAMALFERIELSGARPVGSAAALKARALRLTGDPSLPRPTRRRNLYATLVDGGHADVFITYRSSAALACAEVPALQRIELPPALAVPCDYGLVLRHGAPPAAAAWVRWLLSAPGQAVLQRHGFEPLPV